MRNFYCVTSARYIADYRIFVSFEDGKQGEINLENRIKNGGEVFIPLRDVNFFKNFYVENYTITWENGADLAPEYLYELLTKTKNK